jgi:hypothetical protein
VQSFPQLPFAGPVPASFVGVAPEEEEDEEAEDDDEPTIPDDDDEAAPASPSLPAFQL